MNWDTIAFDWNQVRAFLATAEEGSLSAAARALKQTQPTLSRQVTALEDTLGVTLFERGHRTIQLTHAGTELLGHVRAMADAAGKVSLVASGQSQAVEGHIRITATELLATYHLPAMIQSLREIAPGLVIDVVASDEIRDLMQREADIAIRHAVPDQPDLVAKRINNGRGRMYASRSFLARHGMPKDLDALRAYDFVGIENMGPLLDNLNQGPLNLSLEQFRVNSSSGNAMLAMIRQGIGIGFLPSMSAELHDDLVCLFPDQFDAEFPVWLVSHRELQTSRRIRVVYDHLAEGLARI
ncbi:MAG: LysR family transcriptional regulator [Pseudomonadota bacterium]